LNARARMRDELGIYARSDQPIVNDQTLGLESVLGDPSGFEVQVGRLRVRVVDRRLVGVDWLRSPAPRAPSPARFVFASLKGGVGRSTALAVAAASRAARGERVLAIDLDMEAPGLGAMLLDSSTRPDYGTIDALVESGLAPLDDPFYADLLGAAPLAGQRGRIDVIPAVGRKSMAQPADVLAKLARAYAEGILADGGVATIADRVRSLVDHFADPSQYDAIFIDARAGLHETTASSIVGLGAEVLLFGLQEPQTFEAYAALLAHLARYVPTGAAPPEWLDRLTGVQAKASAKAEDHQAFREKWQTLFERTGLAQVPLTTGREIPLPAEPLKDVPWSDDDALVDADDRWSPQRPLVVLDDSRFRSFDPLSRAEQLDERACQATFGELFTWLDEAIVHDKKARP
jgi:hypothetical protein